MPSRLFRAFVCCLGIISCFLITGPVLSQTTIASDLPISAAVTILDRLSGQPISPTVLLQQMASAQVVYLGETHDRAEDHQSQQAILQALYRLKPNLTIGMEMFQRPYQVILDRYLRGDISETALQERTEYNQRWHYPWQFYAPILQFAQAKQLPVIALNVPTEVTRKVARMGLESLTIGDRRFIPPLSAIYLGPDRYRERLRQIYQESHQGKGNNTGFDRFFQAQVLWDETMAQQIAQSLQQDPDRTMLVLVGKGHVMHEGGIPDRVARRFPGRQIEQITVLLNPSSEEQEDGAAIGDYFWSGH